MPPLTNPSTTNALTTTEATVPLREDSVALREATVALREATVPLREATVVLRVPRATLDPTVRDQDSPDMDLVWDGTEE